jgi:hypothetical protein
MKKALDKNFIDEIYKWVPEDAYNVFFEKPLVSLLPNGEGQNGLWGPDQLKLIKHFLSSIEMRKVWELYNLLPEDERGDKIRKFSYTMTSLPLLWSFEFRSGEIKDVRERLSEIANRSKALRESIFTSFGISAIHSIEGFVGVRMELKETLSDLEDFCLRQTELSVAKLLSTWADLPELMKFKRIKTVEGLENVIIIKAARMLINDFGNVSQQLLGEIVRSVVEGDNPVPKSRISKLVSSMGL